MSGNEHIANEPTHKNNNTYSLGTEVKMVGRSAFMSSRIVNVDP